MLCFLEERLEWRLYVKERPIYIKFDMFSFIVIVNDRWIQEPKNVGRKQFSKLCTRALKTLASLILSCPARGKKPFPSSKALHVSGFRLLVFFLGPNKTARQSTNQQNDKACPLMRLLDVQADGFQERCCACTGPCGIVSLTLMNLTVRWLLFSTFLKDWSYQLKRDQENWEDSSGIFL